MAKTPLSLEPYRDPAVESRLAIGFAVLLTVLVLLRLPHLSGPIDDPNAWRQCDTAQYALNFYRHGFDLLHPAVNWMGAHRVVALEFPLPEALLAVLYHLAGPGEERARVLTLLFFAGGAWYFFLWVRRLSDAWTAMWTAAVYAVLPLAWFYSRALLIDIYVLFFLHAWAYHWLRAADERSNRHLLLGTAALAFGAAVKAPLALPIALPLFAAVALRTRCRDLLKFALAGIAGALPFLLWRWNAEIVNQAMPNWQFIPDYNKLCGPVMNYWYFGDWAARLGMNNWEALGGRMLFEVMTPLGWILGVFGLAEVRARRGPGRFHECSRFLGGWVIGSEIYLLVFFKLNVDHSYYQLPLLGPAALAMGFGLDYLRRWTPESSRRAGLLAAVLVFALLAGLGWRYAEAHYYRVSELAIAGREVRTRIPAASLLVVSYPGTDCRDPRMLYFADHDGWTLPAHGLTGPVLKALRQEGAEYLAVVGLAPPSDRTFLPPVWQAVQERTPEGVPWGIWLYRLKE